MFNRSFVASVVAVVALTLTADDEKAAEGKKSAAGPPHSQMLPEGGWDRALSTLGEKPAAPWAATTIGAGVDKKPLEGKVTTVTGEISDLSCYLQLGKYGEKHRSCGQKCLAAGQPIGLLTKTGGIYILMEEEHDPRRDSLTGFRKAAGDHFAYVIEVAGTEAIARGVHAIYVQGFVKT